MNERAISPVVGTSMLVVITLLLASMFSAGMAQIADFGTEQEQVDELTNDTPTPTATDTPTESPTETPPESDSDEDDDDDEED